MPSDNKQLRKVLFFPARPEAALSIQKLQDKRAEPARGTQFIERPGLERFFVQT